MATQSLHAKGFSPVCTRRWVFKFHDIPNCLPQYVHRYSRTGVGFGGSSVAGGGGALAAGKVQAPQGGSRDGADPASALGGRCDPPGGDTDLSCYIYQYLN